MSGLGEFPSADAVRKGVHYTEAESLGWMIRHYVLTRVGENHPIELDLNPYANELIFEAVGKLEKGGYEVSLSVGKDCKRMTVNIPKKYPRAVPAGSRPPMN